MNLSDLNLDIRAFNAVCRAGFKTAEGLFHAIGENQESVRLLVGRSNFDRIDEAFAELEDKGMLEFTTKLPPAPAEETTPEYLEAFNLNARIHYCKDSVERGLAEMCIGIEQMRSEKQYKQLGYQNFEGYCQQEFGFTRVQGTKYADVGKMLKDQNVKSTLHFDELGMEKLHLLSKLDEPTLEVVAETVDVESVTVKELKAQITALTAERDEAKATIETKDKQFRQAMDSKNNELTEVKAGWKRRSDTLLEKIAALRKELEETKAEPQEVAVEDTSRVEELQKQLEQAQAELAEANAKLAERPIVQEALPVADTTDAFKAYMSAAADSMRRLLEFVGRRPNDPNRELYLSRIDGVLNLSNTELSKLKGVSSCQ